MAEYQRLIDVTNGDITDLDKQIASLGEKVLSYSISPFISSLFLLITDCIDGSAKALAGKKVKS